VTHVVIRSAVREDARFLAWAILTASRGHLPRGWFDIALDQPESGCLEFLKRLTTTTARSCWHYSRFLVAEAQAQPVSTLCTCWAADAYAVSTAALIETMETMGLPPAEQALIWERGSYLFNCTTRPDEDCWIIENIATLPDFRRHGYTAALLAQAVENGRAQGLREAQITFIIGNESGELAYKAAGFHFAHEQRHPAFEATAGAPGLRRFVRALQTVERAEDYPPSLRRSPS
jgi:GNAT superfamily N-acetyltransferase